jgi:outer membrane protein OmpA-like peptidoglycan-associated protein
LLCVAARLLGETVAVKAPLAQLDELDQQLEAGKAPRALETASELRSQCQRVLSGLRREHSGAPAQSPVGAAPASPPHPDQAALRDRPAPIPADQLLTELSSAGHEPSRDERGVSVVLRDVFEADGSLSQTGRAELEQLGQIAKEHPDFPVLLVGHTASADSRAAMDQKLGRLAQQLGALGVAHLDSQDAGTRQPLLPPELPHARQRNQRIELVFVAPGL